MTLTGALMPWKDGPVFLEEPGSSFVYLPCFSKAEALEAVMRRAGVSYEEIVRIEDEEEFLAILGIPEAAGIRIVKDPYFTVGAKMIKPGVY